MILRKIPKTKRWILSDEFEGTRNKLKLLQFDISKFSSLQIFTIFMYSYNVPQCVGASMVNEFIRINKVLLILSDSKFDVYLKFIPLILNTK